MIDPANIDKTHFSIEPYSKIVPKPWGSEIHLAPETEPYMAKIININAGCRLSMQLHDQKTESWTLMSGQAGVMLEDDNGQIQSITLQPGVGYTSLIGQRHRLFGITDCAVFEASTPELGTTLRLEDDYSRPDETEAMRNEPKRGWTGSSK